jgi:hypothetical protein
MPATADRDDLLGFVEIDTLDTSRCAEDFRYKRTRQVLEAPQVLRNHGEKAYPLLGLAIGIDNRFFDKRVQSTFAEGMSRRAALR